MRILAVLFCSLLGFTISAPAVDASEEYWPSAPGMTRLSKKEYAPRQGLALFGASDVPQRLPSKTEDPLRVVVPHSAGESTVEILFSRYVNRAAFSSSGKGEAVPISVRLSTTSKGFTLYSKKLHRRLELSQSYKISGQVYRKYNRNQVVALTHEVLQQTFCKGGTVSENHDMGDFVTFYGPRSKARSPEGFHVLEGVVVNFRCSRWRAN